MGDVPDDTRSPRPTFTSTDPSGRAAIIRQLCMMWSVIYSPRCSALSRWVVAGVEGRLATRISHRPRNFLNEEASVVEYQSLGRDPSSSPVPGTIYFHQFVLHMYAKDK